MSTATLGRAHRRAARPPISGPMLMSIALITLATSLTATADQSAQDNQLDLYLNDKELLLAAAAAASAAAASADGHLSTPVDLMSSLSGQFSEHSAPAGSSPGHYEFDVAPKMEPPSVRKPPYRQTNQVCPGSDVLGGFSARDTLCGDLNQGQVPINPLGQSVHDHSYPFELIKNKTLQFLAKALPVLKLEYESIPKVARYLPAHQLLNPTSLQSPLGHDHFDELNQRFLLAPAPHTSSSSSSAAAAGTDHHHLSMAATTGDGFPGVQAPSFVRRRRRRKRAAGGRQQAPGFTVAEMTPNVSLVVSSAHSSPGRIQSRRADGPAHLMVTKDGLRQIPPGAPAQASSGRAGQVHDTFLVANHDLEEQQQMDGHAGAGKSSAAVGQSSSPSQPPTTAKNHANNGQPTSGEPPSAEAARGSSDIKLAAQSGGQVQPRAASSSSSSTSGHLQRAAEAAAAAAGAQAKQMDSNLSSSSSSSSSSQGRKLSCSELGNAIASTVCQTAAALIDGDKTPAWLQVAKQVGSLYGSSYSSSSSSSSSSPSSASSSWADFPTLLGLLTGSSPVDHSTDAKSSAGVKSASNLWSYLSPFASSFLTSSGPTTSTAALSGREQPAAEAKSASSSSSTPTPGVTSTSVVSNRRQQHDNKPATFGQLKASTLAQMALAGWATAALAGLLDYFVPSAFAGSQATFARRKKPFEPGETFVDTPASLAALKHHQTALASPLVAAAAAKQPPTPCPSMEEYISPTFARNYQGAWKYVVQIPHEGYFTQTIQRSSCMRSRCEFTDGVCHEAPRWVSLLVAEIYYPNAVFGTAAAATSNNHLNPVDPSTSTSTSTATNTATANLNQRSGSINNLATAQSSPHLQQVALGHQPRLQQHQHQHQQQQPQQQQLHRLQQQASVKSISSQDPLQMTDSLNTYNHNLNSAFFNAATQLGLDPSNINQMQQFADSHSYQLLQRNGLLNNQNQHQNQHQQQHSLQVAESRSSHGPVAAVPQAKAYQQQVAAGQPGYDVNNYEYIRALAVETLRENPHLTVEEILKSLQLQTSARARRKRDLAGQQQQQQQQPANLNYNINQRSSSAAEYGHSMNELAGSYPGAIQPQLTAMKHADQATNSEQATAPIGQPAQPADGQQVASMSQSSLTSVQQQHHQSTTTTTSNNNNNAQVECDGHDKIGCYVVRVYYDWFLVNGSCKCWRTNSSNGQQSTGGGQQSSTNSFLRRIFTG